MNSYWAKYIYVPFFNLTEYIGMKYFWPHLKILFLIFVFLSELAVGLIFLPLSTASDRSKSGILMRVCTHHLDRNSYWCSGFPISILMHTKDRDGTGTRSITHWGTAVLFPAIWSKGQGWMPNSTLAELKVVEMSPLLLKMRKWCPGNIICVFLIQKDGSNLYWASTELVACN